MQPRSQPPHVLVMNDSQEIVDVLGRLLDEEGYRVTTSLYVLNPDRIKAIAPDVIVADVLFETQLKGWEFLVLARLDRDLARIPIVLCTAAVETVKGLGEQLTAQNVRVVFKPFDIDELTAAIADALAHGAERATRASAAATDGRHRPGT